MRPKLDFSLKEEADLQVPKTYINKAKYVLRICADTLKYLLMFINVQITGVLVFVA